MEDLAALLALIDTITQMTDEELASLAADLEEAVTALLDSDNVSDEALTQAEEAAGALEAIRAEQTARTEAAAERAERAQALRDRVRGEEETDDDGGDDGDPEASDAGEDEDAETAPPPALPVAASRTSNGAARVSRVAARGTVLARQTAPPSPPLGFEEWGLVASANAPGVPAGSPVNTYDQLARVFEQAWRAITGPATFGPRTNVSLVRAGRGPLGEYGERRTLDSNAVGNASKIRDVVHPAAITAAGGWCVPAQVNYDQPVVGSTARPVRDTALARFGADRGGVRSFPSPTLADVDGAIGIWTQQDDIDAGGPPPVPPATDDRPTKPCLTMDCPTEVESIVQAITECFRTGNFRQRFFPEQIEAVMRLISVAAARKAESILLSGIDAASTQLTPTPQLLGTTRDVLPTLDLAIAAFRDRWRLGDTERLRWVAPRWLLAEIRADLARSMPAGTLDETLAVADASIQRWLSSRGVNITWHMDAPGGTGAYFPAQGAGALTKWPTTVETWLYPEGSFLFLDGGSLDLGLVRDSSLNAVNDLMFFSETFEGLHFQGYESLSISMTVCPDGSVAGTADVNPCA